MNFVRGGDGRHSGWRGGGTRGYKLRALAARDEAQASSGPSYAYGRSLPRPYVLLHGRGSWPGQLDFEIDNADIVISSDDKVLPDGRSGRLGFLSQAGKEESSAQRAA